MSAAAARLLNEKGLRSTKLAPKMTAAMIAARTLPGLRPVSKA